MTTTPVTSPLGALVSAPVRQPLPYGLFSVLTFGTWTTAHSSGIRLTDRECGQLDPLPLQWCTGWELPDPAECADDVKFEAFSVPSMTINPIFSGDRTAQERAEARLLAFEQYAVEKWLWGLFETRGWDAATSNNISATIGLLEEKIAADYSGVGVIHLTRGLALWGLDTGVLETSRQRLQTKLGTPVVAGGGYGTVNDGAVATGPLVGFRSDVYEPDTVRDLGHNNASGFASRDYVIGFDDCVYTAIKLERTT